MQKPTITDFHILVGKRDALEAQKAQVETELAKVYTEMDRMAESLAEQSLQEAEPDDSDSDSYPVDEELAVM